MHFNSNNTMPEAFWESIRRDAANKGIPIHGHFELTPKCNLDCKMCYIHLNNEQMIGQKELSLNQWKHIIDGAIDSGMIFASLSGGECLTYPGFDEIYYYLVSKGIMITVLTNGVLLDKKIQLFLQYPPTFIQVSMYGDDEETFTYVTGKNLFSKVRKNVDDAIRAGLPIGISITCSKYLKKIDQIVRYYKSKNIGVTVNQWLMPPYDSTGRKLDDFNLSAEEQVELSLTLNQLTNSKTLETRKSVPEANTKRVPNAPHGITCAAGRSDFSINWKGEMEMCVALNTPTGFPLSETFEEAWKKTNHTALEFQMPVECFGCVYKQVCNHCPAQHLVDAEYGYCSKNICYETQKMFESGLISLEDNAMA